MLPSRSPNRFAPRVEARSQVLAYRIPVVGTGFALHYASDRVPGRRAAYQLRIPLRGGPLPYDIEEIALEVTVGDSHFVQRFPATQATYQFTWEEPPGDQPQVARTEAATVRVGYVHRAIWPRPERIRWREYTAPVGVWDARSHGLGGWTLTPHHALDDVAGVLYAGDGTRRMAAASDASPGGERWVPSESASEIYVFNTNGRHLRTLDGITGAEWYAFGHDADGRLESIRLTQEELCRIERGGASAETGILAPGGARTSLELDEAGYLRAVVDPAGDRVEVRHASDGLLLEIVDPRGNPYRFTYDELGRLASEEHPGGGGSVLRRTTTEDGFTVRRSTATGLELVYGVERLPDGVTRRVNACCAGGGQTVAEQHADGRRVVAYPDGSTLELEEQPDPRFGSSATLLKKLVRRTPSGLTGQAAVSREMVSADPGDPLKLRTQTDSLLLNGRPFIMHVDVAEGRASHTSAEGRISTATIDAGGRLIAATAQGFAPLQVERDGGGRMIGAVVGPRRIAIRRDDRGRPTEIEYGAGRILQSEFDAADRALVSISAGSLRRGFEYDAGGNLTAITAPSGASHRFVYGPTNRWTAYELPTGERYEAAYDPEGRPALARLPSGREVRMEYDETGWLRRIRSPDAEVELGHDAGGHLANAERKPADGEPAQGLTLVHDGPLVTSVSWRGPTTGTIGYTYDADFRVASIGLEGQPARKLTRDGDGLITSIGPFSVARQGPGGAVSAISDERLVIDTEFDSAGRIAGRAHRVGGKEFYRFHVERDEVGSIRSRQEALSDRTISRTYTHDLDGQLIGVDIDGSASERYAYDANGNRVHSEAPAGDATASFDAADRLIALGGGMREVDSDGFLKLRNSQTFEYSARGELLRATGQDGSVIRYTHDGLGRLVARTDASGTEQYLYNHIAPFPELLASTSPTGAMTEYYFDAAGNLFALVRDGSWFYVACDEIGSPRVVVDAGGRVVKALERDAFGVLGADSDPGFELVIGFAGGLVDRSTGLVHFGRRDYDPAVGRWTGPDPAGFGGGDANLYRYVWNDPGNLRDPNGTQLWPKPFQHQSSLDPVFTPEPPDISDPNWFRDTGPQQWEEPQTDTFPVAPGGSSFGDNFAGNEPTPGGEYWRPGFYGNNFTRKGQWCEGRFSVGGIGESASPYSSDNPGANPGGTPESGPSRFGGQGSIRF